MDSASHTTEYAERNAAAVCVVSRNMTAVGVCDTTEFIYTGYEGTDEAEVDECYEKCVGAGAVIGEEGCNSPCCGEYGDDKEDEDIVWCQSIV